MGMKITPAEASRLLREMKTTGPSREAGRWTGLGKEQFLHVAPAVIRVTNHPKNGQWRLDVLAGGRTAIRRRRIVRVAALKYRARKRRR